MKSKKVKETEQDKKILECLRSLIYHGRNFSPKRDEIVLKKSLTYIKFLTN